MPYSLGVIVVIDSGQIAQAIAVATSIYILNPQNADHLIMRRR